MAEIVDLDKQIAVYDKINKERPLNNDEVDALEVLIKALKSRQKRQRYDKKHPDRRKKAKAA